MKKTKLILIAFVALLVGCHNEPLPEGILDQEAMTNLLTDVYLLEGFYADRTNNQLDSVASEIRTSYDSLFHKHNVTPEQFENNLAYYAGQDDIYDSINQHVLNNIKNYNADTTKNHQSKKK